MKICFAASSGGHFEELSRLKKLGEHNEKFLLTEKGGRSAADFCDKTYYVYQINRREFLFIFKFLFLFIQSLIILIRERPDCIISTGALVTYPISLIGKLMGKKIIYIESFARVKNASLTGKLMYKIADLFIVQWEEMLNVYPNAKYAGGIF